jgi:alkanesulfonate monooxygenase SsuD/methylene tetrahydromethanopterin reductase-like flavin-dependent oxidoreductase (luciferase family)
MVVRLNTSDPWITAKEEQPEVMRSLNRTAARISLNGRRHYTTPLPTGPAPSVTTIIGETASEANKRKLEMWSKSNPGVKEAAAERGTAIHYGMEQYLKGNKTPEIKDEYADFWAGHAVNP